MLSLRVKFMLALLATSLMGIALVGLIARWMLLQQFSQLMLDESFERYRGDVAAYIAAHGAWEQARKSEAFGQFSQRRNAAMGPLNNGEPSTGLGAGFPGAGPPPGQEQGQQPPPGQAPGPPPPPGQPPGGQPPGGGGGPLFQFMLLDPQGRILMGPDGRGEGNVAPPDLRAKAEPVLVKGRIVALAVPLNEPNLSMLDRGYLAAIRAALLYGIGGAGALAIVLGVFLGNRLSSNVRELTAAIQAMNRGDLLQEVRVQSRDEIGLLSHSFNRMSADLARAHAELQRSNATISQQAEQLRELSVRDELTRLYNRRHFNAQAEKALAQALRHSRPLSMMIGDIDHFKGINDRFSHATGDEVLRRVAGILQSSTRQSDIVARYGGEEFAIVWSETPLEQAASLCEKLRARIEEHPWHEVHPDLRVTMSMGLNADTALDSFEAMLAKADANLYHAKHSGRNRVCITAEA